MTKTTDIGQPLPTNRITIGIPIFHSAAPETLDDYMRFAYYLGRRYSDWEFFLACKSKTEQFRARNALVNAALQVSSKYLLMIDDDHVIDFECENIARLMPTSRYEFLRTLINHMEADPKLGAVGLIYYHRGGECRPVVMKEGQDGGFYWLRDDEIEHGLQEVAVIGGGCMLLRCEALLKIPEPIFEPETYECPHCHQGNNLGTDIQICKKLRDRGWKVACDTSLEIGHVKSSREVISSRNRHKTWADHMSRSGKSFGLEEGINRELWDDQAYALYRDDISEYTDIPVHDLIFIAQRYDENFQRFKDYEDPKEYYASLGNDQAIRNCIFQSFNPGKREQNDIILSIIDTNNSGYGLDFGCGTSFLGFELALRGHKVDFVDIDGAPSYEFVKWRAKKRNLGDKAGFRLKGPYDYIIVTDVIEHLKDWKQEMLKLTTLLKDGGALFCNFWVMNDFDNPEHINTDKEGVQQFLIDQGIYPVNQLMWIKYDLSKVGKRKESDAA